MNILKLKEKLVNLSTHERIYIKNDLDLLIGLFGCNFVFSGTSNLDKFWQPQNKNLFIIANMKTRLLTISYDKPLRTQEISLKEVC